MSSRRTSSEQTVIWVAVGLVGAALGLYALRIANNPPTASGPASSAPVVGAREPRIPLPPTPLPRRGRAERPQAAAPIPQPTPAKESPDEHVSAADSRKAVPPVDPAKGFEDGSLFDQPTGPDGRGRPGASSFENPRHGRISDFENPSHGYSGQRAPNPSPADRPNRPDPSFRNPN